MARILITGGAGFIGSHLARACLERGDSVTVFARPGSDTSRLADVLTDLHISRIATGDVGALRAQMQLARPEVVFHLGTRTRFTHGITGADLADSVEQNLVPLLSLLSVAADVPPRVLVRSGSIAEYGPLSVPFHEAQREAPHTLYAASMLAGTQYLAMARPQLPFSAVTARLALSYGPDQNRDFFVPEAVETCLEGRRLTLRRPRDRRDLIHVSDVVAGLLRVAEVPEAAGPVVNLSTGVAPTMQEVASEIVALTGADPALLSAMPQTEPASVLLASPEKARTHIGWQAEVTLKQGLEGTVAWQQQTHRHLVDPLASVAR